MGRKSEPFPAYPDWTTAKFWAFLRSGLRAKWTRWPPKYEVLRKAKRPYVGENKRQKHEFQCAHCGLWHPQKNVTVDHMIPAGQLRSWEDLPGFAERLFCSADKLQVLCDVCHAVKTKEERAT